MRSKAIMINGVSALYSLTAVSCFFWVSTPLTGLQYFHAVVVFSVPIIVAYGFLFTVHYAYENDRVLGGPPLVASITSSIIAVLLYALSFAPTDGDYAIVFIAVSIMQSILAAIALCIVWWRMWWNIYRPRSVHGTPNPRVESDAIARLTRTR
jgi:hypothetical protein